jgi:small conductance mechanosensitive channel
MSEDASGILDTIVTFITTYGLDVVGAIVILVVGLIAARIVGRVTYKVLGRTKRVDPLVRGFLANMAKYLVTIVVVIAVLSNLGVEIASLVAVIGAIGLAIGFALQGVLGNIAAGVMLLIFRPFKVGDFVETAGQSGTVKELTLTTVELATVDNVQVILPNGQVWGSAIKNYSYHETRRVDLAVGIGYEDDIDGAHSAIMDEINADSRALKDPEPQIAVVELGDNAVQLTVRVWCQSGDYWPLRFDLLKRLKERLDTDGISIPYPQRTVHLLQG